MGCGAGIAVIHTYLCSSATKTGNRCQPSALSPTTDSQAKVTLRLFCEAKPATSVIHCLPFSVLQRRSKLSDCFTRVPVQVDYCVEYNTRERENRRVGVYTELYTVYSTHTIHACAHWVYAHIEHASGAQCIC